MRNVFVSLFSTLFLNLAQAGTEGMPSMPKLEPKKITTVQGNEDFESQKGFGDQAPMVQMMNLMMVEGSGMEGMSMDMPVKAAAVQAEPKDYQEHDKASSHGEKQPTDSLYEFQTKNLSGTTSVGVNSIEISITDVKSKKPVKGLKLKAQVFMTSMDMGTEEPEIKEMSPGKYQVKAPFAMKGPWAIKLILPDGKEKLLNFDVTPKNK